MRTLLVLSVLLTGCLVPLDVSDGGDAGPSAQGGGTGGGGASCDPGDGGEDSGIDWSLSSCHLGRPTPRESGAITLLFPGCRGPVSVAGARGLFPVTVRTDAIGTSVSNDQWPPGLYQLQVGTGVEQQTALLEVYELQRLDAGVVRTYADPLDTCLYLTLTDQDRLVCQRLTEVTVYETDGAVHASFAGEDVAVAGNQLWSRGGGGIELRLDGPSGVTLVGALADARLVRDAPFGETTLNRSMRGSQSELIEFSWDGSALSSRSWPIGLARMFVFRDGETIWTEDLCTCLNGNCAGLERCQFSEHKLLGLAPERAWAADRLGSQTPLNVVELLRPVAPGPSRNIVRPVPVLTAGYPRLSPGIDRPVFVLAASTSTNITLVGPSPATHFVVTSERVLANTHRALITSVGTSTVRITPHQ